MAKTRKRDRPREQTYREPRYMEPGGYRANRDGLEQRLALFEVETPQRRLEDLVVPAATRRQIEGLLTKIRHHKVLYEDFGLADIDPQGGRTAINLYGPPGTGKTLAAEAIAHDLGMGIIRANYAEIESKYVGETAKNIKAAFQKAREAGAVLFFDEADSILGKRLSNVRQSTDHAVNVSRSVMLLELDSFNGVTIFATNLAANYDSAFVRRILGHIAMPLPDAEGRRALWQWHLPAKLPVDLDAADLDALVAASEGLAGGDILNAVLLAAASAIQREGPGCRITREDFMAALNVGVQVKKEVGTS
jgi:SpoVK/Ycf46/Vps4 family AAA+-type ATPase